MTTVRAERAGNRIVLDVPWSLSTVFHRIPGARFGRRSRRWEMPLTWPSCLILRAEFGDDIAMDPEIYRWAAKEKRERVDPVEAVRGLTEYPDVVGDGTADGTGMRLYPYQRAGKQFLLKGRNVLLADEQGTGKTVQVLSALGESGAYPAVVVCPNSIKYNWAKEVGRWLPSATPIVLDGSLKAKRDALARVEHTEAAVVIVNLESVRLLSRLAPYGRTKLRICDTCRPKQGEVGLRSSSCETHLKELNTIPFRTAVLDECHRAKDPSSKQTRAVWSVFHGTSVDYRWALTGTPTANHPGDLWSVMHTVCPEEYPVKSVFVDRYAATTWGYFGNREIVGLLPERREEFFSILGSRFRRMQKAVVLPQLPPKVRTTRMIDMSSKQASAYGDMQKRLATFVDGTPIVAANNMVAATRLLQFASATCRVDKGDNPDDHTKWKVVPENPSPKIDEMMEIIREAGGQVAVSAEHKGLINLAAARLAEEGIEHVLITGDVSTAQRNANVEAFQAGEAQVILYTVKAGGVGLTLTAAGTLIRLQRSWSMVDNLQGEDRVHRVGSEIHSSIHIVDLVATGTIEEQQIWRLMAKMSRLEEIVRDREDLVTRGLPTDHMDDEEARIRTAFLVDRDASGTPVVEAESAV